MNYKFQLLITFLFLYINGIAQNNNQLTISDPHPVVDYNSQYFQESEDYIVSVKFNKKKLNIQSFKTSDLKEIGSNTYKSKDFDKNVEFEFFYEVGGRFYLLYSFLDRKTDTEKLLKREIDPKTAKFTNDGEVIISQKGQMFGRSRYYSAYMINTWYTDKYNFMLSKTDKTLLVTYKMLKTEEKQKNVRNHLHVFNSKLEKLWHKNYLTADSNYYSMNGSCVDDKGNLFMPIHKDHHTIIIDNKKVHGNFLTFKNGGKDIKAYDLKKLNQFGIFSPTILSVDSSIIITGSFKGSNTKNDKGLFWIKVDNNGNQKESKEIVSKDISSFFKRINHSNEILQPFKKAYIDQFYFKEALLTEDNGVIIIYENLYYTSLLKQDMSELHKYYYKDIIITKLNQNGELEWTHSIEKNQFSGYNNNRLSYKLVESQNAYNLLFIGHLKSKDIINSDPDHEVFHYDDVKGALYNVSISKNDGSISKKVLFDSQDVNGIEVYNLGKNRIVKLNENEIAIEVYKKGNEDVWVRIPLE